MKIYDTIILGAGASGLMAARQLQIRNKDILILDMGAKPGRKVAISGGGKCNFTNTNIDKSHYFGKNPQFVMSGLNQFTPEDTLNWVKSHNIKYIEKEPERYFCKNGAYEIVDALLKDIFNVKIQYNTIVQDVDKKDEIFILKTNKGEFFSKTVIVATGGMSYSYLGISDIGYKIAKKFGHKIEPVYPGLCALKTKFFDAGLAGISLPVKIKANNLIITDDLLFTHFGIGGPAVYRASLEKSDKIIIDFAPNKDVFKILQNAKKTSGKKNITTILSEFLPIKFARFIAATNTCNMADYKDVKLKNIAEKIQHFEINDITPIGMQSAEVTIGGVSTDKISSKTMESKICDGLFFCGEVIDVAGDLGGYNLQWAFSSGYVAGNNA